MKNRIAMIRWSLCAVLAIALGLGSGLPARAQTAAQPSFHLVPTADSLIVEDLAGGIKGVLSGDYEPSSDLEHSGVRFQDGKIVLSRDRLRALLNRKSEAAVNFWINADAGSRAVPFCVRGSGGDMLRISIDASGLVSVFLKPSVYDDGKTLPLGRIAQGEWVFVTVNVSLQEGSVQLLQNGEPAGEGGFQFLSSRFTAESASAADEWTFQSASVGRISIYPSVLTEKEIKTAMSAEEPRLDGRDALIPLSSWSFDDAEGTVIRAGGSAPQDGELRESVLVKEGVSGRAASFPGEKMGYMDIGKGVSESMTGAAAISVSFWMRNKAPAGWGRLIALYTQNEKALFHISYNGGAAYDRRMIMTVGGRSCPTESYKSRDYNIFEFGEGGDWIHVTAVLDFQNKQIKAYYNGEYTEPYYWNNNPVDAVIPFEKDRMEKGETPYNDCIGGDIAIRSSYPGFLDEVAFFGRAVTDEEARLLYLAGKSGAVSKVTMERERIPVIQSFGQKVSAYYHDVGFAVYDGKRVWFNDDDHTEAPVFENGRLFLPVSALNATGFTVREAQDGLEISGRGGGHIPLERTWMRDGIRYAAAEAVASACGIHCFTDGGLAILYADAEIADEIKTEYLWLLTDTNTRYPVRSHKNTRSVIASTDTLVTGIRFGDPSLTLLDNGHIIATYIPYDDRKGTMVHRSTDGGVTWETLSFVPNIGSVTPFQVDGVLYLMGIGERALRVLKSTDEGVTWTEPMNTKTGLFAWDNAPYPHAISPVLFANGRVYRAFEEQTDPTGKNQWVTTYRSFMVSAPLNSDLLDMDSWTFTNLLDYDFVGKGYSTYTDYCTYNYTGGWLEGNAVASPDGKVYNMLRLQTGNESGYAALCTLSEDNKTLSFDIENGIVHFEGGMSKFVTRYDERSGYYVSVANIVTDKSNSNQRNVLGLNISKDLYHWKTVEILLCDETLMPWYDSVYHHGFQYVDWVSDGDDLLMTVRESADKSKAYHEANRVTFYRIRDFRKYFE